MPGVDYVQADLGGSLPHTLFDRVQTVVHCAAETAGTRQDHERNSVAATRNLFEAARHHGVARFIHISSVAVLKHDLGSTTPLNEAMPVDYGNLQRGPYVWGKAESERLLIEAAPAGLPEVKILRLAPLVDMERFQAPGRLGREIGCQFIAIGSPSDPLSLCDVKVAAHVIGYYVEHFDEAPPLLNLVQPSAPTRGELAAMLKAVRPDLTVRWMPFWVLKPLSRAAVLLQCALLWGKPPLDLYAAFASIRYDTSLAAAVIERTGR
jgi:nucleoside-diphosphate-sugar epimerase